MQLITHTGSGLLPAGHGVPGGHPRHSVPHMAGSNSPSHSPTNNLTAMRPVSYIIPQSAVHVPCDAQLDELELKAGSWM